MANGAGPLVPAPLRRRADRADRLLLRRVRLPRVARHLLGRPRRARRRPHEVGQRHGPAGDRRRAAVSQGLLPPDDRRRRPPGARLPRLRPDPPAARPRPGRVGAAADGHRRAARTRPVRRGLGRPGRPGPGPPARHGPSRRTTTPTGRSPTSCTSAAARCGSTRSSSSAIGGVRAIRALGLAPAVWHLNEGHSAFLLAERAREYVAGGRAARRRLADGPRATACSPSTRRSRPATSGSTPTSSGASPARCSTAGGVPVERRARARPRRRRATAASST